jgi:hypothetical protein
MKRMKTHRSWRRNARLVGIVIDETNFLQSASLQIGQGLRDYLIVSEFVRSDMDFRLG